MVGIPTQFAKLARTSPWSPAVTCCGDTISRRELDLSSNRLARAYARLGVATGDYVTIMLPNSIEWYQATLAVWKLGAIPQPLPPLLSRSELDDILALTPRALIVGRTDLATTGASVPAGYRPAGFSDGPLPEVVSPAWKAMASGGNVGTPKLIEATSNSQVDLAALGRTFAFEPDQTQLVTDRLSDNNALMSSLLGLSLGQHLVVLPKFNARNMLRLIAEHRISFVSTVPAVLQRVLIEYRKNPSAHDLSSLRRVWHGAASCPPAVKRAWIDIVGPDRIWEYFSSTEQQAGTIINGLDWMTHPGSVGTVAFGQIEARRSDGSVCAPGEIGELFLRPSDGPTYRYIGAIPEKHGEWETVGDLGYFDEDKFLYLSDRRVDMFDVGDSKVYPAEVESALSAHPSVRSCLVVGVPDAALGQVPYALIETEGGREIGPDRMRGFLRQRLTDNRIPRYFEYVDRPLLDGAGKARRRAARQEIISRIAPSRIPLRSMDYVSATSTNDAGTDD